MSVLGSVPITSAFSSRPVKNSMVISSAPSITWLFVTTKPSSEITKPEPSADDLRGVGASSPLLRSRNSLKKSSKGDPSGTMPRGPVRPSTVVEVVIFTTDGLIFSASGARLSGLASATTVCIRTKASASIPIINHLIWGDIASVRDWETAFGCIRQLRLCKGR